MEKVRIGIIGMGGMGCNYASMLLKGEVPGAELTAVTRIGRKQGEWAKRELPSDVPVFETAEELLEYKELDAVIISTPHYSHEEYAIKAMEHGLHVMCEKPAGAYTLQAERMNREAAKHSLVFAMMFNQRTSPFYRRLKEMIAGGTYGAVRRVNWMITNWYRTEDYYNSNEWRAHWATEGGGVLLNQAIHNLDMLQWLCGMPCRIRAFCQEGRWHNIEVEDEVTAYMEFPNGATGTFIASTGDYPGVDRLQIDLEKAQIICENNRISIRGSEDKKTRYSMEITPEVWEKPYHTMLENFALAVREGTPLIAPGTDGINSLMICNAMYLSSWQERTVELPFDGEVYYKELQQKINLS